MHSRIERIRKMCKGMALTVEAAYPNLHLCYIVHGRGQFAEAIALYEEDIILHPASEAAQIILQKFIHQDESSFLGLAIASKPILLGFSRRDSMLALININADTYKETDHARHDVAHYAWHAIDLMKVREQPDNKKRYQNGPLIPKRSAYNSAKANIRADIFSSVYRGLAQDKDAIQKLGRRRAMNVLKPQSERMAEDYPFIIAMEPTAFAFEDLIEYGLPKGRYFSESLEISEEAMEILEEGGIGIEQWWSFAAPAQNMAWRGFSPSEILGAAINTSEDAYIRAIGYLIGDILSIEPKTATELQNSYNAFTYPEHNKRLHISRVDDIFEEMIAHSLQKDSSEIMLLQANAQNEKLIDGHIIGWCANALQAAALAFERALKAGKEPSQAARIEFEGTKGLVTLSKIEELSKKIIERKRMGYVMTLGHATELCESIDGVSEVLKSLQNTMQDAEYVRKLKASNELHNIPTLQAAPSEPSPTVTLTPVAPVFAPAPSAPGLGGGSSRRVIPQQSEEISTKE